MAVKRAAKGKAAKKKTAKRKSLKRKVGPKKVAKRKVAKKKVAKRKTVKKKAAKKKAVKAKAGKRKTAKKKVVRVKARKKRRAKSKRRLNPAFMRPLDISDDLAKIVGSKPIPRTEVVKKLWRYIKRHDLQDSKNRRYVVTDAKLKAVFGSMRKKVSIFEMHKLLSPHLT